MKYHLLAFTKASAGGVTLEDVPGVTDQIFPLNASSHYLPPWQSYIRWAATLSPNTTVSQINVPHFRRIALPAISPNDIGTTFTSLPAMYWLNQVFPMIPQNDETAISMTDTAGGAIQKYCFLGLIDQDNRNIPQGEIITLQATASITSGNKVWGAGTLAFNQTLPVGVYSIVGMDAVGANLLAARLILPGTLARPGCLARVSEATKPDQGFRAGKMGEWGRFSNTAPPVIELFGSAAPTTQIVSIDCVYLGPNATVLVP